MIKAFFKFARIRILISCFGIAFLGILSAGSVTPALPLCLLLLTVWIVHANSINDYTDLAIDKINLAKASDRPLVSGLLSLHQFWQLHLASIILIALISFLLGTTVVLLSTVIILIDYVYSLKPIRITDRPILSPLVLAFAYVYFSFNIGFFTSNPHYDYPTILVLGIFVAFTARMFLKDYRDIAGDKKFGKRTFLITFGSPATCLMSGLLWILAGILIVLALPRNAALEVAVLFGVSQVVLLLYFLSRSQETATQLMFVRFIANAANYLILAIGITLATKHFFSLSPLQVNLLVLISSLPLLFYNVWRAYKFMGQPSLKR